MRFAPSLTQSLTLSLALLLALAACQEKEASTEIVQPPVPVPAPTTWLISNVTIMDGSGAPGYPGSVRIDGKRIAEAGNLEALPGEQVIDGLGQVLAPGFVDTHSHADSELASQPDALSVVSQGITTVIAGNDGHSNYPLANFKAGLKAQPTAVNVASYVGHNSLRREVMGAEYKRAANAGEIESMESLLLQELESGALGLSTGLEYDPGIYSDPAEVLQLAKVTAQQGGRYISHIRSEDRRFEAALQEVIDIGRATAMPVQISHIKLAQKRLWGRAPEFLAQLDAARAEGIDITADIYPYEYWQSDLMVLLPGRDIKDRKEVELALTEIVPPDGLWMTQFDPQPEYVGKTLTEIAALRNTDPVTAFMQLIAESVAMSEATGKGVDAIVATSMVEEDILNLLAWPHTNVCTDGGLVDLHPRARGTTARVLGRYARELGRLSLEQAVHKMSGLPALHMGISKRGRIEPGMAADLVLFDPATVIDRATPQHPEALSTGISSVWVNGELVYNNGTTTGKHPGTFIVREEN